MRTTRTIPPPLRATVLVVATLGLLLATLPASLGVAEAQSTLPSGRTEYRGLDDYHDDLAALAADHPDLVQPFTLPYESSSGRPVQGIEITNDVGVDDGKPVLATVALHHGNEFPSGELTMEWAIDVVRNADDPYIADLLDRARIIVLPVTNPDGLVRGRRQTDTNVDMNRNYGLGWSPISTGGSAPFSEPETRNIKHLLETNQVTTFVTQHTCIQVILYPPLQVEAGPTPDEPRFHELASTIAGRYGPGYEALRSADDYETTGEAIDWSYYATRGLGLTVETCPDRGVARTFETQVLDVYDEHRRAMFDALEHTADPSQHATITGKAPKDAVLRVTKSFDLWTSPFEQPDGTVRPVSFSNTLTSQLDVTAPNGRFTWAVNPSYRPIPAYQEDGLAGPQDGFYEEPWILTCERPDGTVLQTVEVNVDLGERVEVDLQECKRDFHRRDLRTGRG